MEDLYNRKVAIKALTGSHNYNLNTENSDKDYKYFVYPNFDDLYTGKMFSTAQQSETVDFDVHDVRQLGNLLWKANLNFVEVLYSRELSYVPELAHLFINRDLFANMNLPYFYNATYGMHLMKMKDLCKGTAKTDALVAKYGYDTKQACHALRCLYVLDRLACGMSMGEALWFETGSHEREVLLSIKAGNFTEDEFRNHVTAWHIYRQEAAKKWASLQIANEWSKAVLDSLMRDIIKEEITRQG